MTGDVPATFLAIPAMARWLVRQEAGSIPPRIRRIALHSLIDTLGVITAGGRTRVAAHARLLVQADGTAGPCGLAGSDQRAQSRHAALVNAVAAHALDFDDNCYAGFVHGSAVIVPAALAVAQQIDADGQALLTALVVGAECQYTLGLATDNRLYRRGWWSSGILGPIGACAAAAWLLRLDEQQAAQALGLAAASAAGIKAGFGTDAKALLAGRAAEAGVMAAWLAQAGATGPVDAFEHRHGVAHLFNDAHFDGSVFTTLGRRWTLEDPGLDVKRIPVCLSSHAAVDVVVELIAAHGVRSEEILAIHCDVPPIVIANLIHDRPHTPQQAQFSMPFAIAAAVLHGGPRLQDLEAARLAQADMIALMAKVSMSSSAQWQDPALQQQAPEGAEVCLALRDGRQLRGRRDAPRGAAREPLTPDQQREKFLECLRYGGIDEHIAHERLAHLEGMEALSAVRTLFPFSA